MDKQSLRSLIKYVCAYNNINKYGTFIHSLKYRNTVVRKDTSQKWLYQTTLIDLVFYTASNLSY